MIGEELEIKLKEHPSRSKRSTINNKSVLFEENFGFIILDYELQPDVLYFL
jgi:hypothetical protein